MAIEDLLRSYGLLSKLSSSEEEQNKTMPSVKASGSILPGLLGNTELLMGLGLLGAASKGQIYLKLHYHLFIKLVKSNKHFHLKSNLRL